jgi:hypothetical protein
VRPVAVEDGVEGSQDVWMREGRKRARLGRQSVARSTVIDEIRSQDLGDDERVQLVVPGEIRLVPPAAPEESVDVPAGSELPRPRRNPTSSSLGRHSSAFDGRMRRLLTVAPRSVAASASRMQWSAECLETAAEECERGIERAATFNPAAGLSTLSSNSSLGSVGGRLRRYRGACFVEPRTRRRLRGKNGKVRRSLGLLPFARVYGCPANRRFERTGANRSERSLAFAMQKVVGSSPIIRF